MFQRGSCGIMLCNNIGYFFQSNLHNDQNYFMHYLFIYLFITSLAKEVMFLVALLCLFVWLSVDNITQKVINGL